MTCNECIHRSVCYRKDCVNADYADKCGDFLYGQLDVPDINDGDMVSRQAAIDAIERKSWLATDAKVALKGTMRGLSSVQQKINNTIHLCDSCQKVYPECDSTEKDVIFGNGTGNDNICACACYEPSVQPERKTGEWIEHKQGFWTYVNKQGERDGWIPDYECSVCGSRGWRNPEVMNWCPVCGSKMKGE